jgi:hypothetical protein
MFRSLIRWRSLVAIIIVFLLLLVAAMIAIPRSLKRRWAAIEARMAEAEISAKFLPLEAKPLSAEGNFFNHPALIDLPLKENDPTKQKLLDARRQKLIGLQTGLENVTLGDGSILGRPLDFKETAKLLVETKVLLVKPASGAEAQAIRAALESRPALKILIEQAKISHHAEFIPALSKRPVPELLVAMPAPHLDVINRLSKPLILHGMACVELGDFEAALHDLRALSFMSEACRRESYFITELVAITLDAQALKLVWHMLAQPTLPASALQPLRELLTKRIDPQSFYRAAKGEFAIGLQTLDYWRQQPQAWISEIAGKAASPSAVRLQSNPWVLDLNRCFYAEVYLDHMLLPLSRLGLRGALAEAPAMQARLEIRDPKWLNFDKLFAMIMIPTTEVMLRMNLYFETQLQQALTACEVELFQRQHGRYPTALTELPNPLPLDPLTQRPFSYRLTRDTRYQLWSPGHDGKDDQGHVPQERDGSAPKTTRANYLGDWTWRYTLTP